MRPMSAEFAANPMARAVVLGSSALGSTSPNPSVGAVIVRDGRVVGEGYTFPAGQNHAEINALRQAGNDARDAMLYVTLEPCCHHGRTPPCTDAIIAAGISHVVFAVTDPNPRVSGGGAAALRTAGLTVECRPSPEADQLHEAFAKHIVTGLPFVVAKFAMSLDGKIATRTGASMWITGPLARARVQQMRKELDGIMVGISTALADNPQLTARDISGDALPENLQPVRIVLDSGARTPATSRMFQQPGRTIIAAAGSVEPARRAALEAAGALVVSLPGADGRVDLAGLLSYLGDSGLVSLLVEGGGGVLGAMLDARLVDKVHAFIGPMLIGGADARSPVEGVGARMMSDVLMLKRTNLEQIGPDWLITGYPDSNGA